MLQCLRYWFYGLETYLFPRLVKKFPTFCRVSKLSCVFTSARHTHLSWARCCISSSYSPILLLLICLNVVVALLRHSLANDVFPWRSSAKNLHAFLFSPVHTKCLPHPSLFHLIIPTFGEGLQLMKRLVLHFSPTFYSFPLFGSKYYPRHLLFEQPLCILFSL